MISSLISKGDLDLFGKDMYTWAADLFPICRSITGEGVRTTLRYLNELLPSLKIYSVPSGTSAFDWTVPDEWNIRDAFIETLQGQRIIDFKNNNLHVVSYSQSVDRIIDKSELINHLHSDPSQPNAIPYVTSYYERNWGFCITDNQLKSLSDDRYRVVIDSSLEPGFLNYGELIIPGESTQEVLISTYICHPSMANNELSGPVVVTALARWLLSLPNNMYTYRIIFVPETIGSIVYLSKNIEYLKSNTIAGFNITCVGDDKCYSFLASRYGNTLSDNVADYVLSNYFTPTKRYSFLDRGSDERQYCSPLVDLPVVSLMRSKYGTYPEYHTSLDDLDFISETGLSGSLNMISQCIYVLENNRIYCVANPCEPQLGKRGLYPAIGTANTRDQVKPMMNILAYLDGTNSLLDVSRLIGFDFMKSVDIIRHLLKCGVIRSYDNL
jgi:aminopeptidase-like protein